MDIAELEKRVVALEDFVASLKKRPVISSRFVPPTRKEVMDFIELKGMSVNVDKFFFYYEANGWKVGRNPMKSWQAAIAGWNSREPNVQIPAKKKNFL